MKSAQNQLFKLWLLYVAVLYDCNYFIAGFHYWSSVNSLIKITSLKILFRSMVEPKTYNLVPFTIYIHKFAFISDDRKAGRSQQRRFLQIWIGAFSLLNFAHFPLVEPRTNLCDLNYTCLVQYCYTKPVGSNVILCQSWISDIGKPSLKFICRPVCNGYDYVTGLFTSF